MTLKEQLEQGQYQVDTRKVADAILRNPLWLMLLSEDGEEPDRPSPTVG